LLCLSLPSFPQFLDHSPRKPDLAEKLSEPVQSTGAIEIEQRRDVADGVRHAAAPDRATPTPGGKPGTAQALKETPRATSPPVRQRDRRTGGRAHRALRQPGPRSSRPKAFSSVLLARSTFSGTSITICRLAILLPPNSQGSLGLWRSIRTCTHHSRNAPRKQASNAGAETCSAGEKRGTRRAQPGRGRFASTPRACRIWSRISRTRNWQFARLCDRQAKVSRPASKAGIKPKHPAAQPALDTHAGSWPSGSCLRPPGPACHRAQARSESRQCR